MRTTLAGARSPATPRAAGLGLVAGVCLLVVLLLSMYGPSWRPGVRPPAGSNPLGFPQEKPADPPKPIAKEEFPKILEEMKKSKGHQSD